MRCPGKQSPRPISDTLGASFNRGFVGRMQKPCPRVTWDTPPPDGGAIRLCSRPGDCERQGWSCWEQSPSWDASGGRALRPHHRPLPPFPWIGTSSPAQPRSHDPESSLLSSPHPQAPASCSSRAGREANAPVPDPHSSPGRCLAWRGFNASPAGGLQETRQEDSRELTGRAARRPRRPRGPAPPPRAAREGGH